MCQLSTAFSSSVHLQQMKCLLLTPNPASTIQHYRITSKGLAFGSHKETCPHYVTSSGPHNMRKTWTHTHTLAHSTYSEVLNSMIIVGIFNLRYSNAVESMTELCAHLIILASQRWTAGGQKIICKLWQQSSSAVIIKAGYSTDF